MVNTEPSCVDKPEKGKEWFQITTSTELPNSPEERHIA